MTAGLCVVQGLLQEQAEALSVIHSSPYVQPVTAQVSCLPYFQQW